MQRNAVRRFVAARPGWELVAEFVEEGVSAFKNSSEDRDILQDVLAQAKRRAFDVLLVFKADRLSRQSFEYPFILSMFSRAGVKVFSVADEPGGKELKVEGQYDKLLRFLEGWQAETESHNTSIRVSEKMRQIAEKGKWTGGRAPYGYKLERRTDAPVPLAIDPAEAALIRRVFDLYLDENLGTPTITYRLNAEGYRQRNGKPWSDAMLRRVMQNPILTGRLAYGRTRRGKGKQRVRKGSHDLQGVILSAPYEDLVIIPQDRWERAMDKMQSYNRPSMEARHASANWHTKADFSRLLFTGMARCSHCGGPMVAGTVKSPYRRKKDGSVVRYQHLVYICQTKATRGTKLCGGQRTYSAQKVEGALLAAIRDTLANLDAQAIIEEARRQAEQALWSRSARREWVRKQLQDAETIRNSWLKRLDQYFLDPQKSLYSEAVLAEKVRESEEKVSRLREELEALEAVQLDYEAQKRNLEEFLASASEWWRHFLAAPRQRQKALLKQIVEKVVIGRSGYEIHYRISLEALTNKGKHALQWRQSDPWPHAGQA